MTCTRSRMSDAGAPRRLGRQLTAAMACVWIGFAAPARAEDPQQVIASAMDRVVAVLSNADLEPDQKGVQIEAIVDERFDFERMSRLVLGRNWKKLSPEQRGEFQQEFETHMKFTYRSRFDGYTDENIEVLGSRSEGRTDVVVRTALSGGAADGIKIDYRLRPRDESWLVIDVLIEGVSLISNFRSQIQEIVTSQGAEELIRMLREKNEQAATAATSSS